MVTLSMHTTTDASSFSSDEWAAWDAFLASSGEPSLHLSSGAVRASLRSPYRAVRVAVWRDDHDVLMGIAVCEDSEAISQSVDDFLEGSRMFARAKAWLHRRGGLRFAVRVIGSPLASGPHGARFAPGVDEWGCLQALLELPAIQAGTTAPNTQVVKDKPSSEPWASGHRHAGRSTWQRGWVDLEFDPVMRVHLNGKDSWEDYLAGMRTKARTKVKRIQTLSKDLEFRALTKEEMTEMQDELHALYMSVYGRAGFRLGCLQKEDFALLKEEMGEGFQLWVATLEGRIIGFHCGMCDGQDVEAYFVGFEGNHNKSHALYQRMLLEFIQWGLREGCGGVNLGRTALDIKASLGAEPQRLVLHERVKNPIVHRLARWAARASAPKQPPLKRAWKEVQATVEEVKSQAMGSGEEVH